MAAVTGRIAADVDELARARRARDLSTAAVLPGPDLEFRAFCTRRRLPASPAPQRERARDAWQAGRYQRGEISQRPGYTGNRSATLTTTSVPLRTPGQFRKLDAITGTPAQHSVLITRR